jgi:hypothetical protein
MLPLALAPMLRSVLVRMPRQAMAVLPVMEPVMGPATGQGTKGSDLKTAPALELQNNSLDPSALDIATGADSSKGDCPGLISAIWIAYDIVHMGLQPCHRICSLFDWH